MLAMVMVLQAAWIIALIPEPATVTILAMGGLCLLRRRRNG